MEKKLYVMPLIEVVRMEKPQLLSGSGVSSDDEVFDIVFGGTDTEGIIVPQ